MHIIFAVSSRIQQCQVELQQMRERTHALQGELVVKNMKLADMEVKCKLLCVCKNILQEQRDTLYKSKRQLAKELVSHAFLSSHLFMQLFTTYCE